MAGCCRPHPYPVRPPPKGKGSLSLNRRLPPAEGGSHGYAAHLQQTVDGSKVAASGCIVCAVSADAVRLAFSLGREHFRSFSTATHGGTSLRRVDAVDFATLRPPHPRSYATHPPSSAQLHSLRAPSFARSESGVRHCYAEPGVYVRCRLRRPPSALLPSDLIKVSVAATPLPRGCRHTAIGRVARLRIPPLPHPNMGAVGSTPLTFLIRGGVLPPAPISRAPSPQGERLPIA